MEDLEANFSMQDFWLKLGRGGVCKMCVIDSLIESPESHSQPTMLNKVTLSIIWCQTESIVLLVINKLNGSHF